MAIVRVNHTAYETTGTASGTITSSDVLEFQNDGHVLLAITAGGLAAVNLTFQDVMGTFSMGSVPATETRYFGPFSTELNNPDSLAEVVGDDDFTAIVFKF